MPFYSITLNLPGFTIKKTSGYDPIIHDVVYHRVARCCYCCSKDLRKKDSFVRLIEHETVGLRRVLLRLVVHKYQCRSCYKYFRQRFDGILPWQRSTEPLKQQIYHLHTHGISRKDLSRHMSKSDGTISRYYNRVYHLQDKKRLTMRCPRVLGIDEHYFSKKQKRFATTFCDLGKHRVFDVVAGKSAAELKHYLENLPGKERVQIVCIDLSSSYRSLVRKYFPNAKIVSDRFHVVRVVQHHMINTAIQLDPLLKAQRGMIRLLRKHADNLTEKQAKALHGYWVKSPQVKAVYEHKEQWMELLLKKKCTKKMARPLAKQFFELLKQLKELPIAAAQTLAATLESWQEEIGRMWRFSKTNGITEGFHRKMKLIQRRAFGFRNFENYRKRVRVLCA